MALDVAFIGFRHGHIFALHNLLKTRPEAEIVAACEEDAATRAELPAKGVAVTHESYERMLDEVDCDAVACGDYFGIRGERLLQALERGRHVISDKPICTRLTDLAHIQSVSVEKGLRVGCMLDFRDSGMLRTLRRLIRAGAVGDPQTVCFLGQHPLLYGTRPMWYFEDGKHGGTINDIAIHALDALPWLTGHDVTQITAGRVWNARLKQHPEFQDGAVILFRLANGCEVMGDVSYLSPDAMGYAMPSYWRITIAGPEGTLETSYTSKAVSVFSGTRDKLHEEPFDADRPGGYFDDFLDDLAGRPNTDGLHTARVLRSSHIALIAQSAAETGAFPREVE